MGYIDELEANTEELNMDLADAWAHGVCPPGATNDPGNLWVEEHEVTEDWVTYVEEGYVVSDLNGKETWKDHSDHMSKAFKLRHYYEQQGS